MRSLLRYCNRGKKYQEDDPRYFRFNPRMRMLGDLWEWGKGDQRDKIKDQTHILVTEYLAQPEVKTAIMECALHLVEIRRRRQATVRWERFADLGIYYECPDCESVYFKDRSKLELHGTEKHGFVSEIEMVHHGENSIHSVGGATRYEWACNRLHAETNSMFCFDTEYDFLRHLRESHGFQNPRIVSLTAFHTWLDAGRRRSR